MAESEQDFIVEQIDQMNCSILATNCDDIDDWALHDCLNWAWKCELVDSLLFYDIPQFHLLASIEEHLVDICDRVDKTN